MNPISKLRKKALAVSYLEGSFYSIMSGTAESLALYYLAKMNMSLLQIAYLTTIPLCIGAFAQLGIPWMIPSHHLKRGIIGSSFFQLVGLFFLLISPQTKHLFEMALIGLSLFYAGGLVCAPLWVDWTAAWMPKNQFGVFLSRRSSFLALITLLVYLITSLWITRYEQSTAFYTVFIIGLVGRLSSWIALFFQPTSPRDVSARHDVEHAGTGTRTPFIKPVIFMFVVSILFKFMVFISSPFFLPYMLHELNFNLLTFVAITTMPHVGRMFFLTSWGRASRSFRPFVGLQIAMLCIGLNPILWSLTTTSVLLCVVELFSGIFWGGFDLCTTIIIQNTWPGRSRKALGIFMALSSLCSLAGARLGAYLMDHGMNYISIFRASAEARLILAVISLFAFAAFKETRASLRVFLVYLSTILTPMTPPLLMRKRVRTSP